MSLQMYKTQRQFFMNPQTALADGLIAVDDHLTVDYLFEAYSFGIFPWPQGGLPTLWFSPPERGVLDFERYHVAKSFKKFLAKNPFRLTINLAFEQVINECQKALRPGQSGTWITDKIVPAYVDFHRAGYAHSFEAWSGEQLVGGLYGVYVGGVFCGESMFFKESNASKVCLYHAVSFLKDHNKTWMDVQMVTPYLDSVGARYITRQQFLKRLDSEKLNAMPIF